MGSSMKDIKLRIKSVESTMQITKAMELVASSKMRRAKERVEHSRPYFETLYDTLTKIAAMDPRAQQGYLRRKGGNGRTLLVVIAGDRDMIKDSHTKLIWRCLPDAELRILPGTHFIAKDEYGLFNRAVETFLGK